MATPYFVLYVGWIRDLIPSVSSSAPLPQPDRADLSTQAARFVHQRRDALAPPVKLSALSVGITYLLEVRRLHGFILEHRAKFPVTYLAAYGRRSVVGVRSQTEMDKPKILTKRELSTIMPRLAGWKLANDKLSRTFEFQDFVESLELRQKPGGVL